MASKDLEQKEESTFLSETENQQEMYAYFVGSNTSHSLEHPNFEEIPKENKRNKTIEEDT